MSQLLKNIWAEGALCHSSPKQMILEYTCHPPFRCFQRPSGSALPGWSLICTNLWSPSGQREDILCLQNPPFLCLVCGDMTWNDTECISLDVLQLMTPAGLCPLPPSQGNHGKKGGDGKLALECSRDTSTQAINCGTPVRFSVPLE